MISSLTEEELDRIAAHALRAEYSLADVLTLVNEVRSLWALADKQNTLNESLSDENQALSSENQQLRRLAALITSVLGDDEQRLAAAEKVVEAAREISSPDYANQPEPYATGIHLEDAVALSKAVTDYVTEYDKEEA